MHVGRPCLITLEYDLYPKARHFRPHLLVECTLEGSQCVQPSHIDHTSRVYTIGRGCLIPCCDVLARICCDDADHFPHRRCLQDLILCMIYRENANRAVVLLHKSHYPTLAACSVDWGFEETSATMTVEQSFSRLMAVEEIRFACDDIFGRGIAFYRRPQRPLPVASAWVWPLY